MMFLSHIVICLVRQTTGFFGNTLISGTTLLLTKCIPHTPTNTQETGDTFYKNFNFHLYHIWYCKAAYSNILLGKWLWTRFSLSVCLFSNIFADLIMAVKWYNCGYPLALVHAQFGNTNILLLQNSIICMVNWLI